MGYTHYFPQMRAITDEEWQKIVFDFRTLIERMPMHTDTAGGSHKEDPLAIEGMEDWRTPVIFDWAKIRFNGYHPLDQKADLGHETMCLERLENPLPEAERKMYSQDYPYGFNFCKTARKPYDLMVCALLILADTHAPGGWRVRSDGDVADWQPAMDFVCSVLGNRFVFPYGVMQDETA